MRKKFLISLSAALAMSIALPVASYADEWRRDSRVGGTKSTTMTTILQKTISTMMITRKTAGNGSIGNGTILIRRAIC